MRTTLRAILTLLVLAAAPTVAQAQRGFPGGVRDSPRPLADEAGPPAGALAVTDLDTARTEVRWLVGTAGNTSGAGSGFSTMTGLNIKIPKLFSVEGTASYERAMPDDLDATDAYGATLELSTSRVVTTDELELGASVNGEVGWEGDDARSYTAGVSASATFRSRLELGGSLAYAGSDPGAGDAEWELSPGVAASIFPMEELTVGITYTFENDLAVENGYEVVAKYRVYEFRNGGTAQLRIGMDDDERFKAGLILKL